LKITFDQEMVPLRTLPDDRDFEIIMVNDEGSFKGKFFPYTEETLEGRRL
jgi:hypothetical protein